MKVGEVTREFLNQFLVEGEKLEGPILLASRVEVHPKVNSVVGLPALDSKPLLELTEVFVANTNRRILIVSRGLSREVRTADAPAYKGKMEGIWRLTDPVEISYHVSDRSGVFSIMKGVTRASFYVGMSAEASLVAAVAKPFLVAVILAILGVALAFYSLWLAAIFIATAAFIYAYLKRAFIHNPRVALKSEGVIYVYNAFYVPEELVVRVEDGRRAEERRLASEEVVLKIDVHRAVDPADVIAFVKAVSSQL